MEKDQNDQLEIVLKSPIGNETPSVETLINRAGRISKLNGELSRLVNVSDEAFQKNLDRIISSAKELRDLLGV